MAGVKKGEIESVTVVAFIAITIVVAVIVLGVVISEARFLYEVGFKKYDFIGNITFDQSIQRSDELEIIVEVHNPSSKDINPYIQIDYTNDWRTHNQFLRDKKPIPIGNMLPGKISIYAVRFYFQGPYEDTRSQFNVSILHGEEHLIQREEIFVDVKS